MLSSTTRKGSNKMKNLQCDKCAGEKKIWFSTVQGGVCFSCNGTGIKHKQTKTTVVTPTWRVDADGQRGLQQFASQDLAQDCCDALNDMGIAATVVEFGKTSYTYKRVPV
jgi:hypothetical protein